MSWRTFGTTAAFITALGWMSLTPSNAQAHESLTANPVVHYPEYPYAHGTNTYVKRMSDSVAKQAQLTKPWSARISAEGGFLGNHGWRGGGSLLLRYWRLGLSADAHYYSGRERSDSMYLGTAHGTIEFVARPRFNLRLGGGLFGRLDATTTRGQRPQYKVGPGFMTEVDIFALRPVVASLRFDYGRLGGRAAVSGRASLGVMIRRGEVFLAYEAKVIGGVPLRGPQLGVRMWF